MRQTQILCFLGIYVLLLMDRMERSKPMTKFKSLISAILMSIVCVPAHAANVGLADCVYMAPNFYGANFELAVRNGQPMRYEYKHYLAEGDEVTLYGRYIRAPSLGAKLEIWPRTVTSHSFKGDLKIGSWSSMVHMTCKK